MTFHLIHTQGLPILEQLHLEEALLRDDTRNFCLINEGSTPAIVMGISGKVEELVACEAAKEASIPVIKRFSGGGTVVVDQDTLFVTFICQKSLHPFAAYPEPILRWSAEIYAAAFPQIQLSENDYSIGEKKCGGNAQYIKKERWLHHTSFLWDYSSHNMELLLHPKKTPAYRNGRSHEDFICKLSTHFSEKRIWIQVLKKELQKRYQIYETELESLAAIKQACSRQTTRLELF